TVWIDRRKPTLRSVDFEYTRIEPEARGAGGQLVFQLMPTGTPIIVRWVIHFPIFVVEESRDRSGVRRRPPPRERRSDVRVTAYHETGGEIGAIDWPDGMKWRGTMPRLIGTVVDTAGRATGGASVFITGWQTRDTVVARPDGHFVSPFLRSSFN